VVFLASLFFFFRKKYTIFRNFCQYFSYYFFRFLDGNCPHTGENKPDISTRKSEFRKPRHLRAKPPSPMPTLTSLFFTFVRKGGRIFEPMKTLPLKQSRILHLEIAKE